MTARRTVVVATLASALCLAIPALPAFAADTLTTPATRISVTVEGSGSDVVLIPGLNSSPRVWKEMMAALPGHRYHLVKVNGFAGSAPGANVEGLVSAPVAEDVARYIQTDIVGKKLNKPAVIGHSMGGTIGLMVASRHAELVDRLMVVDMVPFLGALFGPPGTTVASITPTADGILAGMRAAEPEARRARAVGTINSMVATESMRPGAIEDSLTSTPDVSARAYHELVVTDLRPELVNIKAPLTVLYIATKGFLTPAQADAVYASAYAPVKGARLKRIDDSAHFLMWDQPKVFQDEVREFLAK
ncbi:MAG TPA: alpha/beta hydrolase [Telluria sp.]|nr:alpha/beta hydrolase [Telluria sp.]